MNKRVKNYDSVTVKVWRVYPCVVHENNMSMFVLNSTHSQEGNQHP